jgi:hypothetical protein
MMRVWTCVSALLIVAGCGSSTSFSNACTALEDCCASGLPSSTSSGCAQIVAANNQTSCASTLDSIHAAHYCSSIQAPSSSSDAGALGSKPECERYLSCLAVATPQAYAGALQLYGDSSPCWENAQTAANCANACLDAYNTIASQCQCSGTTCTEPPAVSCVAPSTPGNSQGVGQYCEGGTLSCPANPSTTVFCDTSGHFCSRVCMSATDPSCGEGAVCVIAQGETNGECIPMACCSAFNNCQP